MWQIYRKIKQNKKGSTALAIAVVMAMAIVIPIITNIVYWEQALAAEDRNLLNEQIKIVFVGFGTEAELHIHVKNVGTLTAHLVSIWINHTRYPIDRYLKVGEVITDLGKEYQLDPSFDPRYDVFPVSVFTERGSSDTTMYRLITHTGEAGSWDVSEYGVFKINWFYCKYSSLETNGTQSDAIVLDKDNKYVSFYLEITNNWVYDCKLLNTSFLTLTSISLSGNAEPLWFIVNNVTYDATQIINSFQEVILKPLESLTVVFAADNVGGTIWKWGKTSPFLPGTEGSGLQISLFYKALGFTYGQTISTQAIVLNE